MSGQRQEGAEAEDAVGFIFGIGDLPSSGRFQAQGTADGVGAVLLGIGRRLPRACNR